MGGGGRRGVGETEELRKKGGRIVGAAGKKRKGRGGGLGGYRNQIARKRENGDER